MNKKIKSYLLTESSYTAKLVATKAPAGSPVLSSCLPSGTHGQTLCYDLLLIFCILLFVLFGSCKNNPVVPPPKNDTTYKFDTARFNWKVDTLRTYDEVFFAYAQDPTHIYMASFPYDFIYYDGIKFNTYYLPNNFYPQTISGFDNAHIFIGGWINPYPYEKPAFLIWDGVSFNQILVTDTINTRNTIYGIYANNLNEIWLGLRYGIIKYDGTNFNYYNTDTAFVNGRIFEQAGQLNCFSYIYNDTNVLTTTQCFLTFESNNWNKIYTVYNNSTNFFIGCNLINNNFYILKSDGNSGSLYKFIGSDITKIMDINKFKVNAIEGCFAGNSESDLLFCGGITADTSFNLFNWNGSKWSKELRIGYGPVYAREFQNNYIAIYPGPYALILNGTRK